MVSTRLWATRAGAAERAVHTRHLRPLWGLPGARLGRVAWPHTPVPAHWHYWWQAQLLDCALDAYRRAPGRQRRETVAALVRGVRLRNLTGWANGHHGETAWFGLALQRGAALTGLRSRAAEEAITRALRRGRLPSGGLPDRAGDPYVSAPATGAAAIYFARRSNPGIAASLAGWMLAHLLDPDTGLVLDGAWVRPDGTAPLPEYAVFSHGQGVLLGACLELGAATGDRRWAEQADRTIRAVAGHLADGGVLRGHGGGDGGLYTAILARYLALAATSAPSLPSAGTAARLVLRSAQAAWRNRGVASGGPVFGPQWTVPTLPPRPGRAERDLSVQLSGWMLLEAAAELEQAADIPADIPAVGKG